MRAGLVLAQPHVRFGRGDRLEAGGAFDRLVPIPTMWAWRHCPAVKLWPVLTDHSESPACRSGRPAASGRRGPLGARTRIGGLTVPRGSCGGRSRSPARSHGHLRLLMAGDGAISPAAPPTGRSAARTRAAWMRSWRCLGSAVGAGLGRRNPAAMTSAGVRGYAAAQECEPARRFSVNYTAVVR